MFFEILVSLLGKHGVAIHDVNVTKTGEVKIDIDFSEHDKVFEDKIADLQQRIRELIKEKDEYKRKCNNFGFENQELKQRITELEKQTDSLMREKPLEHYRNEQLMKTADILNSANKELKKRISELESRETEKPTKINLNDRVKVKLTPLGAEIYYHQYDELNKQIKEKGGKQLESIMPRIDKDGFTEFTLWHFMELYGEHMGMCKKNVIEPLDIIIAE